jgi:multiple sugar transport system ATP-binding protein
MADRLCVLKDGRVQQYAPPQEVFDTPANRFVAEFVGNPPMNVLPVGLDPQSRSLVVAAAQVPLGDRWAELASAQPTHVGARARDLELAPAAAPETVGGSVYAVEPLGDEVFVDVLVGGARVIVRAERGWRGAVGEPVAVRLDPRRCCFFTDDGTTAVHRSSASPATERSTTSTLAG